MGCHLYAAPHRIHRIHRSNLFLFFPRSLGTVSSFGRFSFGRFSFGRFSFGRFLSDGFFRTGFFPRSLGTVSSFGRFSFGRFSFGRFSSHDRLARFLLSDGFHSDGFLPTIAWHGLFFRTVFIRTVSFGRFSFGRFSFGRFLSDGLFAPPPRLGTTEVEVGVCLGLFASWKTIIGRQGLVFEVCLVCQRCSGFCLGVPLLLRPGSAP